MCLYADVIIAIEVDDSNNSTVNNFDAKTFMHSNKLPDIVPINSAFQPSDVFIEAELRQFGPKGNLNIVLTLCLMYV